MTKSITLEDLARQVYSRILVHNQISSGRIGASMITGGRSDWSAKNPKPNGDSQDKGKRLENAIQETLQLNGFNFVREWHHEEGLVKGYTDFIILGAQAVWTKDGHGRIVEVGTPASYFTNAKGELEIKGDKVLLESKYRTNSKFEWEWIVQTLLYAKRMNVNSAIIVYGNERNVNVMVLEFTDSYIRSLMPVIDAQIKALTELPPTTVISPITDDKILNSFPSVEKSLLDRTKTATIRFGNKAYLVGDVVTLTTSWDRRGYMKLIDRAVITSIENKKFIELSDEEIKMESRIADREALRIRLEELYRTEIPDDKEISIIKWDYNVPEYKPSTRSVAPNESISALSPAQAAAPTETPAPAEVLSAPVEKAEEPPEVKEEIMSIPKISNIRVSDALKAAAESNKTFVTIELTDEEFESLIVEDGWTPKVIDKRGPYIGVTKDGFQIGISGKATNSQLSILTKYSADVAERLRTLLEEKQSN